jgi:hypothetical protein
MATTKIRLMNSRAVSQTLFLEPWAEEIILDAGDAILIKQEANDGDPIEIDAVDKGFVLHGHIFSQLRVYRQDQLIWQSYEAPAI